MWLPSERTRRRRRRRPLSTQLRHEAELCRGSWYGRAIERRQLAAGGSEAGLTLIELAIVLVILPLILGAVTYALIVTFTSSTGVSTSLSDSVDSQVTDTFYVRDVQSAQYVTTTSHPSTTPWSTAGLTHCGTGKTYVLGLGWPNGSASKETVVSYWTSQLATGIGTAVKASKVLTVTAMTTGALNDSAEQSQGLVQLGASGALASGTTVASVTPGKHTLTLSKPALTTGSIQFAIGPELLREACKGPNSQTSPTKVTTSRDFYSPFTQAVVSCVANATTTVCNTSHGNSKTVRHQWVPTLGVSGITLAVAAPAGKFNYNLSAAPRVANALGNQFGGCQGAGCFSPLPTLLALGGFQVITETANASITVLGTAVINHGWLTMQTKQTSFTATGKIETTDTPPSDICTLTVTGTRHGKCAGSISPTPVHITSPVADPFVGLADPTPEPIKSCPSGSATLSPGQYQCQLKISGSSDVVTLSAGLYEFDTGVTIGGQGTLKATSDVLIYLPCNTAGPGHNADTWATQCGESFTNDNGSLNAKRMLTGPYAGLWYWQNKGDTQPMVFRGQGSLRALGILYAPGATVTLKGEATTTSVGSVVALNFSVTNSSIKVTG